MHSSVLSPSVRMRPFVANNDYPTQKFTSYTILLAWRASTKVGDGGGAWVYGWEGQGVLERSVRARGESGGGA